MFTGLIHKTARVLTVKFPELVIKNPRMNLEIGESLAVNGCCLTVSKISEAMIFFDVSEETISCTNLSSLKADALVNLEPAMTLSDRLGGHLVSGHVDCCGTVSLLKKEASGWYLEISLENPKPEYLIQKGSICLDGVSLTVNSINSGHSLLTVSVMLIPTTLEKTHFQHLALGDRLNVEYDLLGKYVAQNMLSYR